MQKKYFCIGDKCTLSEDFVGGREEGVFSNKATYVALLENTPSSLPPTKSSDNVHLSPMQKYFFCIFLQKTLAIDFHMGL